MKTILDKITDAKSLELEEIKKKTSIKTLENSALFERTCYSLTDSLSEIGSTGIIAEFKRKSPSKGLINGTALVEDVTTAYTQYGAAGLSILTETSFFGGNPADIAQARFNEIPILRKDFIIDEYQIIEAKALGADVILLIAECLTKQEVKSFTDLAHSLGMQVLFELHSEEQLDKLQPSHQLVGINNRDLKTFNVDLDRSIALSELLPNTCLKIAESGISSPSTIIKLKEAGFNGFLIGEHFMKSTCPVTAFSKFVTSIKELENEN